MSQIEALNDCIFIVGGLGGGADFSGGGCTLEAWNNPAKINKDMTKMMTGGGMPLSHPGAWNGGVGSCTVTNNGAGKVRVTFANGFTDCMEDLAAYAIFAATYATDRYRVIAQAVNYVDLQLVYSADTTCRIAVGGAFESAQNAWSNTSPGGTKNTSIYCNLAHTFSNGLFTSTWYLGTAGGSLANKSFKRLVGFTTQPGDGGQITFDGEDNAMFNGAGGINFSHAIQCVIFENITVRRAQDNWKTSTTSSIYIRFIKCQGNDGLGSGWQIPYLFGWMLIDCQAKNNGAYGFDVHYPGGPAGGVYALLNCIATGNAKEGFYGVGGKYGAEAEGCVANNNGNGGVKYSGFMVFCGYTGYSKVKNCVSYGNGKYGFEFRGPNPNAISCIAKNNGQWGFYLDTVNPYMAPHVAYCCAHGNGSGQFSLPVALPEVNSIEADPLFVDAANADFRLKPNSPCLKTGKPTLGQL